MKRFFLPIANALDYVHAWLWLLIFLLITCFRFLILAAWHWDSRGLEHFDDLSIENFKAKNVIQRFGVAVMIFDFFLFAFILLYILPYFTG